MKYYLKNAIRERVVLPLVRRGLALVADAAKPKCNHKDERTLYTVDHDWCLKYYCKNCNEYVRRDTYPGM